MAKTEVHLDKTNLVKYLTIASKQRKRAAQKFMDDYGPASATVAEVNQEIGELDMAISELNARKDTPLEQAIDANTKRK